MSDKINKPHKYATEAGLRFILDRYFMCQQDEFDKIEKSPEHRKYLEDCNIYFICRRNRIENIPGAVHATSKEVKLKFQLWEDDNKFSFDVRFKNMFNSTQLKTISTYPHNFFTLVDEHGKLQYEAKASYVCDDHKKTITAYPRPLFLDFEVLYIGKAADKSDKPTFNRLVQHETLQKIYSENPPDKEIFLFLFPLQTDGTIEIINSREAQPEFEKEDLERRKKFIQTGLHIPFEKQIPIAEAAIIRYFQPKYNKHHKESFPAKRNPTLEQLYKLDLNSVAIYINAQKQDVYFYSDLIEANTTHSKSYSLHSDTERRDLLSFGTLASE